MQRLVTQKFIYVTGKGGVGKSTVAAGLATFLATHGRRVLLVHEPEALGQTRLLGRASTQTPTPVSPGVLAVAVDPEHAMQEYAASVLHSARLARALFHGQTARGFLYGVPGLSAWAFLGKAAYFAESTPGGPDYKLDPFDTVVVDGPATGDSTEMLRVPEVIRDLAPAGRLRRDAESCWQLLHDPARTSVVVVTTLEELPVIEAETLASVVRHELHMPLGPLLVNRITPALFLAEDARKLVEWLSARAVVSDRTSGAATLGHPDAAEAAAIRLMELGAERAATEQISARLWSRLVAIGLPLVPLPLLEPSPVGPVGLSAVAAALAQGALGGYRPVDS